MASKTERPGGNPGATGEVSSASGGPYTPDFEKAKAPAREPTPAGSAANFFLHVLHDGRECRYAQEPKDRPSLHVWTANGREYTITRSQVWTEDQTEDRPGWTLYGIRRVSHHTMPVRPPGANWRPCNLTPKSIKAQMRTDWPSNVWSRKAVRP